MTDETKKGRESMKWVISTGTLDMDWDTLKGAVSVLVAAHKRDGGERQFRDFPTLNIRSRSFVEESADGGERLVIAFSALDKYEASRILNDLHDERYESRQTLV